MRDEIRLALPSKGRLFEDSLAFLAACGLRVYRPNPRQYAATIPSLPALTVLFQRPGDIVVSVRQGSVDFGITGQDVLAERSAAENGATLLLHDALGFAPCRLVLAVPDNWGAVTDIAGLRARADRQGDPLRVATKYPHLTGGFLARHGIPHRLIPVEGTLEIAPAIGYADLICDLVSTGTTLRDNHLRPLAGGVILESQACLIANRQALRQRADVLAVARQLLEYIEAYLRAEGCYSIFANVRGDSPQAIANRMLNQPVLSGLQGPTIAPVYPPADLKGAANWFAVNIVARKDRLTATVNALRDIGGSGVIVTPVTYIFEEEPARYRAMLDALQLPDEPGRRSGRTRTDHEARP